ncbi:unnamed protein product [Paramecium primaurelia]|uniref:Transmembrane protein n=1 Tax=Paramecium primaurelia TaxID=5886 RepID=A0A8S1Q812_PARPR|nr:unnamed protein product [Paramecium primaurelia]
MLILSLIYISQPFRLLKNLQNIIILSSINVSNNLYNNELSKRGYNLKQSDSFQEQILRHECSELGTMGKRKQIYKIINMVNFILKDRTFNKHYYIPLFQECLTEQNQLILVEIYSKVIIEGQEIFFLSQKSLQDKQQIFNWQKLYQLIFKNFDQMIFPLQRKFGLKMPYRQSIISNLITNLWYQIIIKEQLIFLDAGDSKQFENNDSIIVQLKQNFHFSPRRIRQFYFQIVFFFLILRKAFSSKKNMKMLYKQQLLTKIYCHQQVKYSNTTEYYKEEFQFQIYSIQIQVTIIKQSKKYQ